MNELTSSDTPQQRLRFVVIMGGVVLLMLGAWWIWDSYFKPIPPIKKIALPYKARADVTESFGFLDGDGYRTLTIAREGQQTQPLRFEADEWPLACRFFAADSVSGILTIIELNPIVLPDDPGIWLDANSLKRLPLDELPESLHLLDDTVIE